MIDNGPDFTMNAEGYVEGIYLDSLGFPTCGYGYCLDSSMVCKEVKEWHDKKFRENYQHAEAIYETYNFGLDPVRRAAVIDLIYNLDANKFSKFRGFIAALKMRDWLAAAASLEQSKWWRQVGRRGPRIQKLIKTGRGDAL
jgi:GH24 family phage-related lysozyme (muramidase)